MRVVGMLIYWINDGKTTLEKINTKEKFEKLKEIFDKCVALNLTKHIAGLVK